MVMYAVADRTVKLNGFQSIRPFQEIYPGGANSSIAGNFLPTLLRIENHKNGTRWNLLTNVRQIPVTIQKGGGKMRRYFFAQNTCLLKGTSFYGVSGRDFTVF